MCMLSLIRFPTGKLSAAINQRKRCKNEKKKKRKAVPNKGPVEDLGNHKQEVLKESVRRSLRRLKK